MIYLRHADQRIQFERIGQQHKYAHTVAAQQLLVPHPMELDPLNATSPRATPRALPAPRF